MKRVGFVLLLLYNLVDAQNLVINGGFEEFDYLPNAFNQSAGKYWRGSYAIASLSYMRVGSFTYPGVVNYPQQGLGYIYMETYFKNRMQYHSQIPIGRLTAPLEKGRKYKVSLGALLHEHCLYVTEFDILFSTKEYYSETVPMPTPNRAHIRTTNVIGTASGYNLVESFFIADSAYQYILIGGLFEQDLLVKSVSGGFSNYTFARYYIDDVSVIDVSPSTPTLTGVNSVCLASAAGVSFQATGESLQWVFPLGLSASFTGLNTSLSGATISFANVGVYTLTVTSANQYATVLCFKTITVTDCNPFVPPPCTLTGIAKFSFEIASDTLYLYSQSNSTNSHFWLVAGIGFSQVLSLKIPKYELRKVNKDSISVRLIVASNPSNTCFDTLNRTIPMRLPLQVNQSQNDSEFTIFPNPTQGEISIQTTETGILRFYSPTGQEMRVLSIPNTTETTIFDLSHLPQGFYLYQFKTQSKVRYGKLVVE